VKRDPRVWEVFGFGFLGASQRSPPASPPLSYRTRS
jgi:hypothetical protein